jgi:hypothetical protein
MAHGKRPPLMTILQAWHDSSGDIRSLEVRWNEAAARMRAAGLSPTVPISEPSLFSMRQQLAKLQPPPVNDPDRNAAFHELEALLTRYKTAAMNIEKLQRGMQRWANDPIHRLLRDIPDDCDQKIKPELPRNVDWQSSTGEVRARCTVIIPAVLFVEELRNKLQAALHAAERTSPETLIWAVFERLERNERLVAQNLAAIREQVEALDGKIDRISKFFKGRMRGVSK